MPHKSIEEMDRTELIGMVHALQKQVEDLASPERARLYQLGRLADRARDKTSPDPAVRPPLWKRLAPRLRPGTMS